MLNKIYVMKKIITIISIGFICIVGIHSQNLIDNYQFDDGQLSWSDRQITWSVETGLNLSGTNAAKIIIPQPNQANWKYQLYQELPENGLILAGRVYEVYFMGYADTNKPVSIMFQQQSTSNTPWTKSLILDTLPGTYGPYYFECTETMEDVIFTFMMGEGAATNIYLDSVVVFDSISKPSVYIQSPGDSANLCLGDTLNVQTYTYDNDGTVEQVDFYLGPTLIGTDTTSPFTCDYALPSKDTSFTLIAVATDNDSKTSADTNEIFVYEPTVSSGAITAPVCESNDIQLTESGGDAVSWNWSGPFSFTSTSQSPTNSTATLSDGGTYNVTITDANGCTNTDKVTVMVNRSASLTITDPAEGCPSVDITDPAVTSGSTLGKTCTALDKTSWTGGSDMTWWDDADGMAGVLDTNETTYLNAQPRTTKTNYLVLNMQSVQDISKIEITSGDITFDDGICKLYLSNDSINWTLLGDYGPFSPNSTQTINALGVWGKYLKLELTTTIDKDYWDIKDITVYNYFDNTLTYWEDFSATIPLSKPDSITSSGTFYIKAGEAPCADIKPVNVSINCGTCPDSLIIDKPTKWYEYTANSFIDYFKGTNHSKTNVFHWNADTWSTITLSQSDYMLHIQNAFQQFANVNLFFDSTSVIDASATPYLYYEARASKDLSGGIQMRVLDSTGASTWSQYKPSFTTEWQSYEYDLTGADNIDISIIDHLNWASLVDTISNVTIDIRYIALGDTSYKSNKYLRTTDVTCFGGNDGAINISVENGTMPYTFTWSTSNGSGLVSDDEDQTGLTAGDYKVVVKDAVGCKDSATYTIVEPPSRPTATAGSNSPVCVGNSLTLNETGGNASSWSWSGPNSFTSTDQNPTITSTTYSHSGMYYVTITTSKGCSNIDSVNVVIDSVIDVNAGSNSPICEGDDLYLHDSVGIATNWSWEGPNSFNSSLQNPIITAVTSLASGTYTVTVSGTGGCQNIDSVVVTINAKPNVIAVSNSPVQSGDSLKLTETGGEATNWSWSGPNTFASTQQNPVIPSATEADSGVYYVTVTGVSGCINTDSTIVTVSSCIPPDADISIANNMDTVCQMDSFRVSIDFTAGTPPYDMVYTLNSTPVDTIYNINTDPYYLDNLSTGDYQFIITDVNNCINTKNFTIAPPDPIIIEDSILHISVINGSNGEIHLSVQGGVSPYSYEWNTGDSTQSLMYIPEGIYYATVTDANYCFATDSFEVFGMSPPIYLQDYVRNHISCFGDNNGMIDILTVTGGVPPYSYNWNTGDTTQDLHDLDEGIYTLTITDTESGEHIQNFSIWEPDSFNVYPSIHDVTCAGSNNGKILLDSVTGGVTPYTYAWSNDSTNDLIVGLSPGTYSLTVTDVEGCSISEQYQIDEPAPLTITSQVYAASCLTCANGFIEVTTSGGITPYDYLWSNGSKQSTTGSLARGSYVLTVTDGNGCKETKNYEVNLIAPAIISYNPANGSNGVEHNVNVQAEFNQDIWAGNLNGVTIKDQNNQLVNDVVASVDTINNILLINHEDFSDQKDYVVFIPPGTVKNTDNVGNDSINWNFSTSHTGVDEMSRHQIRVYPVPSKGIIFIRNPENIHTSNVKISVGNILGNKVYETNLNLRKTNKIDLSMLTDGTYFIKFRWDTHQVIKKIIISQ